ncbi:hypothetical protein [Lysinibacillus irui]|uniref:Uncharacterized protein n=1 Tax=Lysinibacillus irui TaxID=2998077 RepID=A0AAJ5RNL9_9BACI|nr:hypothetical protein [Lysinibacillus irui]WDV09301.1 hypothetical protein OU989_22520 [Lysinibacillus irui]
MFKKLIPIKTQSNPTISLHNGKHEFTFLTSTESFEGIKSYLENRLEKQLITRLELSNLIEGNLNYSSSNSEVQGHLIFIMPNLINLAFQQRNFTFIFQQDILTDLSRSEELQQAVFSMTDKKYYDSLTHILDYLLRYKEPQEPLSFMEVYLVYTLVNSILYNTSQQTGEV